MKKVSWLNSYKFRFLVPEKVIFSQPILGQDINLDPALKKEYLNKIKPGESVYHYALKEYLKRNK